MDTNMVKLLKTKIKAFAEEVYSEACYYLRAIRWNFYRRPKFFIIRGIKGWAPDDVWDMRSTLRINTVAMLRYLADQKNGAPNEFFDESNKEDQGWKWKKALRDAADDIEAVNKADEEYYSSIEPFSEEKMHAYFKKREEARKREIKGWHFIAEYIDALWD